MAAPHPMLLLVAAGPADRQAVFIDEDVVMSAEEHEMIGLLDEAVVAGTLAASTEARKLLAMKRMRDIAELQKQHAAIQQFLAVSSALDVGVCLFKGAAVRHHCYPKPDVRPSADIDVFVDPSSRDRIPALVAAFDGSAARVAQAALSGGRPFDAGLAVGEALVDVHSDPIKLPVMQRATQRLWARAQSADLGEGLETRIADLETSVIVALVHGLRDNFADLLHVVELSKMIDLDPDWHFIEDYSAEEGITDIVRYAAWAWAELESRESPIPTSIEAGSWIVARSAFPQKLFLKGRSSAAASLHRQAIAGLMMSGRRREVMIALGHQLLPPRAMIDVDGASTSPYPLALYRWRKDQRSRLKHMVAQ